MKSFMESQPKGSAFMKSNHAGVMRVMNSGSSSEPRTLVALALRSSTWPGASETWAPCGKSEVPVTAAAAAEWSAVEAHSSAERGTLLVQLGVEAY